MNKPFQVYLDDRQRRALDRLSKKMKRSRSDLVRMGIDQVIANLTPVEDDPALGLIGLMDDPDSPTDLALRHDHYLEEAYEESCGRRDLH